MIPWRPLLPIRLFGLEIDSILMIMLAGAAVAFPIIRWRARSQGLDPGAVTRLVALVEIGAFIVAHVVDILCYQPKLLDQDPWILVKPWQGISAFGGFAGAALATLAWTHLWVPRGERLPYADALSFTFPFGWILGRLGCTLALDHPGFETSFPLAFEISPGRAYHNLGFYELLFTIAVAALFFRMRRRRLPSGMLTGILALSFAAFRFAFDFLRIEEPRHAGLTPTQLACPALFAIGLWLVARARATTAARGAA